MRIFALFLTVFTLAFTASAQIIDTEASHAVIMDHETGEILYSKNGDEPMIPASMTKMMTAYLVFDRIKRGEIELTDKFPVSENAWRKGGWQSGGSTMGLDLKDTPTVQELLKGVIILSGNDACIVLAEGLSGSEAAFAAEMTSVARDMGLETASFKNVTGLDDPGHRISAADLARLARLQINDFPAFYGLYAEPSYEWRDISQPNRNPLLGRMDGADGLKTGHLSVSGYGLTASAMRDGVRRTIVINGMETQAARAQEAERLMRIAFNSFETKTIAPDTINLPDVDVWLGATQKVPVSLAEPMRVTAHKRAFDKAKVEIVMDSALKAPIKSGDNVGYLVVTIEGVEKARAPITAEANVDRLGFIGKAVAGLATFMSNAAEETVSDS